MIPRCCEVTRQFIDIYHFLRNYIHYSDTHIKLNVHNYLQKHLITFLKLNSNYIIADTALIAVEILKNWPKPCTKCAYCMRIFECAYFEIAIDTLIQSGNA